MTVLFPLWLPFSALVVRGKWVAFTIIAASVITCLILWLGFVSGVFVG
jgi:hypothetical protein